jgi:hypothetical protein
LKILVNPRPSVLSSQPLPAAWHVIQQPKPALGLGISILTGLGLPFVPFLLLSLESWLLPRVATNQTETIPWWILLPVLLVSVVAHEFLHLLWHPGWGLSSQSLMLIWPRRLLAGVYYEGFMPRTRWLVMRLSPLVGLTVLPTLVLLVVYPYEMSFFWQQFIILVILVNSLGAGGDLVASVIVAQQVAPGGQVGNWNGRACWRAEKAIGSETA